MHLFICTAPGAREAAALSFRRWEDLLTEGLERHIPSGERAKAAFAQWQNGKQELVWPKDFATAPLAYPAPAFSKR